MGILTGGRTPTADRENTGASRGTGSSRGAAAVRSASTGAKPSQPGTRQGGVRSGSTSKALDRLTGRPDKDKKARRRNGEPTDSIVPYEDDKTITFLPAGHSEENTNPQHR